MAVAFTCMAIFIIVLGLLAIFWRRKQFIKNYQEKCVFITGTDTGFGRVLALALDNKGIKVYGGCYTKDGLQSLMKESSDKMKCIKIDVTDEKSLLAAKEYIEADLAVGNQRLWGLVNNAGISGGVLFHITTLDDYKAIMEVNFFGQIRTTEIFLPLIKNSQGRIVNMLSLIRRFPTVAEPYASSKVAMAVYNDGLRRFMKDYGIHVASIDPGIFLSNVNNENHVHRDLEKCWKKLPKHLRNEYGENFFQTAKMNFPKAEEMWYISFNNMGIVSDAITHALFATYPKTTYVCGIEANLLFYIALFFPDCLLDFFIRQKFSKIIKALQIALKNT